MLTSPGSSATSAFTIYQYSKVLPCQHRSYTGSNWWSFLAESTWTHTYIEIWIVSHPRPQLISSLQEIQPIRLEIIVALQRHKTQTLQIKSSNTASNWEQRNCKWRQRKMKCFQELSSLTTLDFTIGQERAKRITYLYTTKAAISSKINKMLRRPPIM